MATFNYTGYARLVYPLDKETDTRKEEEICFIDYAADTGTLRVWKQNEENHCYLGQMREHPALTIHFLHDYRPQ